MRHILVEHDALQDAALLNLAARDLLDLGVTLHIDFKAARARGVLQGHGLHGLQRQLHHDLAEAARDGGSAIAALLVLRAAELDHRLGGGVRDVDLAEDGVAVVRHDDAPHRVQDHLEHGARAQRRSDGVGDSLGRCDVAELGLLALLALGVLVEDDDAGVGHGGHLLRARHCPSPYRYVLLRYL